MPDRNVGKASCSCSMSGEVVKIGNLTISRELALDLDHAGMICFPHERESCVGCRANLALGRLYRSAVDELARKTDRLFLPDA